MPVAMLTAVTSWLCNRCIHIYTHTHTKRDILSLEADARSLNEPLLR
jgi:hypothetical protein